MCANAGLSDQTTLHPSNAKSLPAYKCGEERVLRELFSAKSRTCTVPAAPNTADNKGYELIYNRCTVLQHVLRDGCNTAKVRFLTPLFQHDAAVVRPNGWDARQRGR